MWGISFLAGDLLGVQLGFCLLRGVERLVGRALTSLFT